MKMGYLGVKTMVAHLKNQPVEKRIDTGVSLVTPENMDQPASKELTNPPVEKYLSGQ
jgi:ribose transport system substrate-binding protein